MCMKNEPKFADLSHNWKFPMFFFENQVGEFRIEKIWQKYSCKSREGRENKGRRSLLFLSNVFTLPPPLRSEKGASWF